MDKREIVKIAEDYISSVSSKFALQKAILFGSYAKGDFRADSDIDIALVLTGTGDMIQTQIDMMKLRRPIDLRIEPHPFYAKDFNSTNPVVNEIMKYGIEVSTGAMAAEPKVPYGKKNDFVITKG
jgi:predicted nucleotidyltransferase